MIFKRIKYTKNKGISKFMRLYLIKKYILVDIC